MMEGRYCRAPGCTAQLASLKETHCAFHRGNPPIIVTPTLYAELERRGHDMRFYAKSEPMP